MEIVMCTEGQCITFPFPLSLITRTVARKMFSFLSFQFKSSPQLSVGTSMFNSPCFVFDFVFCLFPSFRFSFHYTELILNIEMLFRLVQHNKMPCESNMLFLQKIWQNRMVQREIQKKECLPWLILSAINIIEFESQLVNCVLPCESSINLSVYQNRLKHTLSKNMTSSIIIFERIPWKEIIMKLNPYTEGPLE